MNASPIHHILFDLGGTLMHARRDWAPVFERADLALTKKLSEHQIKLEAKTFRTRLHEYYKQRDRDFQETTYHFVLRELLKELGYTEIAEPILRSALDAMFTITQANWNLESDIVSTIQKLKSQKYNLGIFSNAGDDKDVQELIGKFGIRSYFDFVLTSAACYYRKPHARAFEIALAQWNIEPEDALMVGDSLDADVFGAKSLGMQTIWLTRRAEFTADEKQRIQPDFSINDLNGLFPILDQIDLTRR
jgi:putative hydrolase of the HAD superfamily